MTLPLFRNASRRAGLLALCLAVGVGGLTLSEPVDAKRLGAGKSQGMQRNMPARTAPDAPPASPAAPAPTAPATAGAAAAAPAAAGAAAAAGKRSWLGPVAGLAAGLGIAALASHLGFGEGLANLLTILLVAAAAFFLIRFLLARFAGGAARRPALAGAAAGSAGSAPVFERVEPMQRSASPADAAVPAMPSSGPATTATAPATATVAAAFVPAAFDSESFERLAKMIFIRLQTANDAADLDDLRRFTTPEMFAALRLEILERSGPPQTTDVRRVDARVVDVATEGGRQVVSVRYTGEVVESADAAPTAFDEIWHLVRDESSAEGAWAIAGIEQMA